MATGLSHHLLCTYSRQTSPSSKSQTLSKNPNCSVRLRTVPKSLPGKNSSTSLESSPQEPKPAISKSKRVNDPDPEPISESSLFDSFSIFIRRVRDGLPFDGLGSEIISIALPAALALAADPIASLVDTAFVGHLGSAELAAVGVSVSVFNLVSKLFNVPLLNITTSFVAEEQALVSKGYNDSRHAADGSMIEGKGKELLPSVSTSLALAASIGIAEAIALFVGSGFLLNIMGIPVVRQAF